MPQEYDILDEHDQKVGELRPQYQAEKQLAQGFLDYLRFLVVAVVFVGKILYWVARKLHLARVFALAVLSVWTVLRHAPILAWWLFRNIPLIYACAGCLILAPVFTSPGSLAEETFYVVFCALVEIQVAWLFWSASRAKSKASGSLV
jgi:hypothetical protein